jgi:hypothetical protein
LPVSSNDAFFQRCRGLLSPLVSNAEHFFVVAAAAEFPVAPGMNILLHFLFDHNRVGRRRDSAFDVQRRRHHHEFVPPVGPAILARGASTNNSPSGRPSSGSAR